MVHVWTFYAPHVAEIRITNPIAEQKIKESLESEIFEMGYKLSRIRVSKLGDIEIVRADVIVPSTLKKIGEAIRVINGDEIEEGINIF